MIAITGGIGAGKSVVSRILRIMGIAVYDCDSRAKAIMDNSVDIKRRISAQVCAAAIEPDGSINRPRLAAEVFANPQRLAMLNAIVHEAVRHDLTKWQQENSVAGKPLFFETAILAESGLDKISQRVWIVTAPVELRIARLESRGLTAADAQARISRQTGYSHPQAVIIANDGITPLLPQIERELYQL